MNTHVQAAIAAPPKDAWVPIKYPRAIWDDQLGRWVSDAQGRRSADLAREAYALDLR